MFNIKFLILNLFIITSLFSNDGFEEEDEFGDDEAIEVVKLEQTTQDDLATYGSVTASLNYSFNKNQTISSLKLSTNLKFEHIVDEFHKVKATIKAYKEYETNIANDEDIDINILTTEGTFDNGIDGKFGRQIVVWGKSDNIRITDTLNPLDSTAPGMVDIEDLRLGRTMTKLDYYHNNWTVSGIVLHENRYSLTPKVGSDYYIPSSLPIAPPNTFENSGIALSTSATLEGQDVAFYYSNQYIDNKTYKSNMLGFAYNKVIDSFLLKTEMAYFDNYDSNIVDAKTDSLVGLEYSGISDGSVSLEIANKDDDIQYAFRFTQSYINQTLDFTTLISGFGKEFEGGGFTRVWFDYDIDDNFKSTFGVIVYTGGEKANLEKIKDNDRIFVSLKYSF